MKRGTFIDIEYSFYKNKKTKREDFLKIMDGIIPWDKWAGVIALYYPQGKTEDIVCDSCAVLACANLYSLAIAGRMLAAV